METLFSFLHLSDIHMGHGDARQRADQRLVLDRLVADVRAHGQRQVPAPDIILVTGDVTSSGNSAPRAPGLDEFAEATAWLDSLAGDLHLDRARTFIIPGNHDVQRTKETDRDSWRLLSLLRRGEEPLDDALRRPGDQDRLRSRLANFLAFAGQFAPACLADGQADRLFWTRSLNARGGLSIRLVGLNTALLANDDADHGHLSLGTLQLQEAFVPGRRDYELVLVLSHHPLAGGWLRDERDAAAWIQNHADIHLSGHLHEQGSESRRMAGQAAFVRLWAGAAHGERVGPGIPETHRYYFAAVVAGGDGQLLLRVWPRRFSEQRKDFILDSEGVEPGQEYGEHPLRRLQLATRPPITAPPSQRTPVRTTDPPEGTTLPERLQHLVDVAHESEIADALSALLTGEHVAFQVPAGFGATRAVQRTAQLCQTMPGLIVHYVPARVLFSDVNSYLDDIYYELKRKAPLPGRYEEDKRDLRLYRELRDAARTLHQEGKQLVVCIDDVDRFPEEHQEWVAELLGVFAHLEDNALIDEALRSVRVVVAGGEWLQKHLIGRVKATPLSPFNKARRIFLGPVHLSTEVQDAELRRVVDEVGGHPDLLLWAARRGGRTDGNPASEEGLFHDQVALFRKESYRAQIDQMLREEEAAWRDPDLAIRWSGWIKPDLSERGWLGPVLERLAKSVIGD